MMISPWPGHRIGALLLVVLLATAALPVRAQEPVPPTITLEGAATAAPATVDEALPAPPPTTGDSPLIQLQLPPSATSEAPPTEPWITRDRASESPSANPSGGGDWLLPLSVAASRLPREVRMGESLPAQGILRLTGETAHSLLTLDLPAYGPTPADLHLALRSGVDVLIGTATLGVSVNGAPPVEVPLRSFGDFSTVAIPASGLRAGANSIALSVRQPHRISCGPQASFHVWTEIDLRNSGASLPQDAITADADGFAVAMRAELASRGTLDLLMDDAVDRVLLRQVSDAVIDSIAQRGRLRVTSFYDINPPRFAAVALIASDRSAVSFSRGATGAIVLRIEHDGNSLPDLATALPAPGPNPDAVPALVPGRATALSHLGWEDIIGNTHYFRRDVEFLLPDDWLLIANQKARLTLRYGFARLLPEGAILLVKVNDQTVRLLPLDRGGGQILPPLPVSFDASLLNPGRNTLSFEMMVPGNPATEACPARTTDMLVVLADSTLMVPTAPAMILPGMATPLAGLMPGNVGVPPAAAADLDLQAEAIRLASGMSRPHHPQEQVTLTLARLNELHLLPFEAAGVTRGQIQSLLFRSPTFPVAESDAPAQTAPAYRLSPSDEPGREASAGVIGRIGDELSRMISSWKADGLRLIGFRGAEAELRDWLATREGEALLWRPDADDPDALWLILGRQTSVEQISEPLNRLIANRSATGEAAVLLSDGSWAIWSPVRPPVLEESLLGGNLRTILGNYASWSPLLFTLTLLSLAVISALPALFYILTTRDSRGRS
ncbi:cellulose biosynthesis cyclic di-GMP-binding regulatory protein BcsB [Plastorhodobacter daqingensis]|uniref:Cyclic di-GMP-binding protein n=1 Tax=Plastorhodobacter daqingensis TaxID=1387281 RepID=A0ABW2UNK8_9RHOB